MSTTYPKPLAEQLNSTVGNLGEAHLQNQALTQQNANLIQGGRNLAHYTFQLQQRLNQVSNVAQQLTQENANQKEQFQRLVTMDRTTYNQALLTMSENFTREVQNIGEVITYKDRPLDGNALKQLQAQLEAIKAVGDPGNLNDEQKKLLIDVFKMFQKLRQPASGSMRSSGAPQITRLDRQVRSSGVSGMITGESLVGNKQKGAPEGNTQKAPKKSKVSTALVPSGRPQS